MVFKNEKIILNFIKFTPPLFIITLTIVILSLLYSNYKVKYLKEQASIEKKFILSNKELIKNNVDMLHDFFENIQENNLFQLENTLRERVNEAYIIATSIYNKNKDKDKETITKMIKDALSNIRFFNGRGYYYIYTMDAKCVMLPINKSLEGTSFKYYKDNKGKLLTKNIIEQLRFQNEGFMSWYYIKPNIRDKDYKKLGFNKYFEPLDWFIGTGEYIEDFTSNIKQSLLLYLQNIQTKDNRYFFIIDYNGNYISHIKKDLIGKSAYKENDILNHEEVFKEIINTAKTKGYGFTSYIQKEKPKTNQTVKKVTYFKTFDSWGWIIAQGFYEDEVKHEINLKKQELEKSFNNDLINILLFSFLSMLILLAISYYMSKLLEKRFNKYKEEIRKHISKTTKQQNLLAKQTKMAAMGEMLGNIAHQWRQPLSIITTASTGVKIHKELGILDDKNLFESLDAINKQANYLSKTIDDFRNFLSHSGLKQEFSVIHAIESTLTLISSHFQSKDIIVEKQLEDFSINAVENEFIQVLINILNNAKDQLLNLDLEDGKIILIKTFTEDNKKIIQIQDSGKGIDEKIIDRVFEPYFTTKHQYNGTGIGLFMSSEIISKQLDGKLYVENCEFIYNSKKYFGANFIIEIKD